MRATRVTILIFVLVLLSRQTEQLKTCPTSVNFNGTVHNCTNRSYFDFPSLYTIVQNIYRNNSNDWRLWEKNLTAARANETTLSFAGCKQIAYKPHGLLRSVTWYPLADIWARLVAWKFPLFQLLATFPRPPSTSSAIGWLIILRLLANPIGTLHDLILKFASCQARAQYWKKEFEEPQRLKRLVELVDEQYQSKRYERLWKAFALIVDSYDEWGLARGRKVRANLRAKLLYVRPLRSKPKLSQEGQNFLDLCEKVASFLAADRTTTLLPMAVAQVLFILSVLFAFLRTITAADNPADNPTVFINVEAYSIAYSCVYFWVISVTILGALIGASQTSDSIPRILQKFETDLQVLNIPGTSLNNHFHVISEKDARDFDGGIYSWQPRKWRIDDGSNWISYIKRDLGGDLHPGADHWFDSTEHEVVMNGATPADGNRLNELLAIAPGSTSFAVFTIALGTITGSLISGFVPPVGLSCRHFGQVFIFTCWVVNFCLDLWRRPRGWSRKKFLAFHITKDFLFTAFTLAAIFLTQWGVFNSCWCYTQFGWTGLALPQTQPAKNNLHTRIHYMYTLMAFGCIAIQLTIPLLVRWRYPDAVRVFAQRDDEESNLPGWIRGLRPRTVLGRVRKTLTGLYRRRAPGERR